MVVIPLLYYIKCYSVGPTKGEEIPEPIAVSKDNGKFQSILKIAEQQVREGKGMKHEDFWRDIEAEKE